MKVMILGGDGFCGWPTSLRLKERGHEVLIVDGFERTKIDAALGISSLTPIDPQRFKKAGIAFKFINVARELDKLKKTVKEFSPKAVIHFAEQRSAPLSMKSSLWKKYTIDNNISATHNVLLAINPDIHLIHLGTLGVYGYRGDLKIPEKGLIAHVDGKAVSLPFPPMPGSVYHTSKVMDASLFDFYTRNNGYAITDLHQGVVWGTQTKETSQDEGLINRFDYDGDFGTVINRFAVQGVLGHPLTVYGTGGQTRGFIHIEDCVKAITCAVESPKPQGYRTINQITETLSVRDIAQVISFFTSVPIKHLKNPRREAAENSLNVEHAVLDGWLQPTLFEMGVLDDTLKVAERYKERADLKIIPPSSFWI